MNTYAIIKDGIVDNLIISTEDISSDNCIYVKENEDNIEIGWSYEKTSNFHGFKGFKGEIVSLDDSLLEEEDLKKIQIKLRRNLRDRLLQETDWIVSIVDYPKRDEYIAYRQQLRDYPNHPDFPDNPIPVKP